MIQSNWIKVLFVVFLPDCLGGYRVEETPGPISNPEAKLFIADNTAPFRCGNVGRCLVVGLLIHTIFFHLLIVISQFADISLAHLLLP